ncbi:MAG: polyprenyl synthetase family protein [Candidatus Thorarchaeota archaeon]
MKLKAAGYPLMSEKPTAHNGFEGRNSEEPSWLSYPTSRTISGLFEDKDLGNRVSLINKEIQRHLLEDSGEPAILYEAARHLLLAGGKRFRSLLLVLCAEAVGGTLDDALPFAVAIEFIQTASLIHDDMVDEDALRRGAETTHEKYGRKMAIIAGDLLIAQAVKIIGEKLAPGLLAFVASGAIKMCEGEAADFLMSEKKGEAYTKRSYLEIVRMKTVSFMASAAKVGASLGSATREQTDALVKYAENLGYAFQIRDDVLDVIASQNGTGKSVLSDLKGSRCNFLLAHALEESPVQKRERCIKQLDSGEIQYALELIDETNAVNYAMKTARNYAEQAKDAIDNHRFENEEHLTIMADFVIGRLC